MEKENVRRKFSSEIIVGIDLAISSFTSPNVKVAFNGPEDLFPYAGIHDGRDAVRKFYMDLYNLMEEHKYQLMGYIALDNSTIVSQYMESGKLENKKEYAVKTIVIATFQDEKISSITYSLDTAYAASLLNCNSEGMQCKTAPEGYRMGGKTLGVLLAIIFTLVTVIGILGMVIFRFWKRIVQLEDGEMLMDMSGTL